MNQEQHNISLVDYQNRKWKIDNIGEDELFNFPSPNITDLIREIHVINQKLPKGNKG